MYSHRPPHPWIAYAVAAAGWAHRVGFVAALPDPDRLRRQAERATGLSDWGDFDDASYEALLRSAQQDANLNALGRWTLRVTVHLALRRWLRGVVARSSPAVRRPLVRPIAVLGMPRCGTTRLHHLLAAHPDAICLPLWLALNPHPAPSREEWGSGGGPRRRLVASGVARVLHLSAPSLEVVHPYDADLPVEDSHLLMPTFRSTQWSAWPVPGYLERAVGADASFPYRILRQDLELLHAQHPGRHWVLKSPVHFAAMDAFAAIFPEAFLVPIHREPVAAMASASSMMVAHYAALAHAPPVARVNRALQALYERGASAFLALRTSHADRMESVGFDDLVQDPMGTVERVVRRSGMRWDDEVKAAIAVEAARPRQGIHRYPRVPEGLCPRDIRQRLRTYIEAVGVGA